MFSNRNMLAWPISAAVLLLWTLGASAAPTTYLSQGKTLYEKGRLSEALKAFEKAGDEPEALYFRFQICLEDLCDTKAAVSVGEQLVKTSPSSMYAQKIKTILEGIKPPSKETKKSAIPTEAKSPDVQKSPETPVTPVKTNTEEPRRVPPVKVDNPSDRASEPVKTIKARPGRAAKPSNPEPAPVKTAAAGKPAAHPKVDADPKNAKSQPVSSPTLPPHAPVAPTPAPAKEREGVVQVNLTADLKDFLKGISELTGENILYDQSVGGQIIMSGPADVPMSQVMDLTQNILGMRGYTMVRMGQGWKVMPSSVALRANIPTFDTATRGMTQEFVTQIIRIDPRLSINEIRNILISYVSPNNNFQVLPKLNLLLLTDSRETIDKVMDIIRRLEEMQGRVKYKPYTLKFAKVSDVKSRLDSILSSFLGKGDYLTIPVVENNLMWIVALPDDMKRIEALIKEMDNDFAYDVQLKVIPLRYISEDVLVKLVNELLQVGTARYAADQFKILPDARRRSVILSSVSPGVVALVSKLVAEIDQPSVPQAENMHIYKVGNADALKIADKLTTLYKEQTGADRIGIVADEQSNSLIITANAQRYAELEKIVAELDKSKSQVWLEVYVVEASEDQTKKIGIQWFAESTRDLRGSDYTAGLGVVTGTTPGQEGLTIGLAKAGTSLPTAFNAFLDNKDFDVLSQPHIMVKDNEKASISVGDVIPVLQNSQVTDVGTVIRTFNFENVGTNLTITPHVNKPRVTLDMKMSIQEVKSVAELGAPTRTTRDLSTTITIESGHTVVLGGILGTRHTKGRSGVPIISKLPVIGALFRKDVYEDKKTNLLIFITPKIVDTASDLDALSKARKASGPSGEVRAGSPSIKTK